MRFRRGHDAPPWSTTGDHHTTGTVVDSPFANRAELEAVALQRRVDYLEVQLKQADACIDDLLQRLFDARAQMVITIERAHAETAARDGAEARMPQA